MIREWRIFVKLRSRMSSAVVAILASMMCALAQAPTHVHDSVPPTVPLEVLQRPVGVRQGVGKVSDPVTTSSEEAQTFYNQGVAYLHSYVWIEAARSFNQALRSDPKLAMAHVGLSRALSGLGLSEAAHLALERAEALGTGAGPREQRRIQLREVELRAMSDLTDASKHAEYKKALDESLGLYPDDVELWLLRGNVEEAHAGGRGQHGGAEAIRYYQRALSLSHDNLAAHHYLVHTYENLDRIEEALSHGEAYARLAPAIPHAHHMYGHDLRRVGRIREAIAEFSKAYELEEAYYKAESIPAEYDWHHQHNLDLLSTSQQYQGRMKAAEQLMRRSFLINSMQEAQGFNKREWPEFLMGRGRYAEALEAANTLTGSRWGVVRAIGHVMSSHALMALGRMEKASEEAKAALDETRRAGAKGAVLGPHLEILQGEFFLRTGQEEKGHAILIQVQKKLRAEPGPDAWSQVLFRLEAIGRIAREAGDWDLAAYTSEQMREHDPAYAGTHFLLGLVAAQRGNPARALAELAQAEKLWADGDEDLPELAVIREKVARIGKAK